jgi:hypothetical protein
MSKDKLWSRKLRNFLMIFAWIRYGFEVPAPEYVKRKVLMRKGPSDAWIETGTYLGDTTNYLAKKSKMVYSIEPSAYYFNYAKKRFKSNPKIKIYEGTSEEKLREVIDAVMLSDARIISFWLDGHYSAGKTFRGGNETPVIAELENISKILDSSREIRVYIDDIRCFNPNNPDYSTYPSIDQLIYWSIENKLSWLIENDILILTKP